MKRSGKIRATNIDFYPMFLMAATTLPICHLKNEYDVYVDTIIIRNKKKLMKEAKSVPLTHIYMIHLLSWLGNCKVVNESPIKFYRTLFLGNVMSKTYVFLEIQD